MIKKVKNNVKKSRKKRTPCYQYDRSSSMGTIVKQGEAEEDDAEVFGISTPASTLDAFCRLIRAW